MRKTLRPSIDQMVMGRGATDLRSGCSAPTGLACPAMDVEVEVKGQTSHARRQQNTVSVDRVCGGVRSQKMAPQTLPRARFRGLRLNAWLRCGCLCEAGVSRIAREVPGFYNRLRTVSIDQQVVSYLAESEPRRGAVSTSYGSTQGHYCTRMTNCSCHGHAGSI